MRKASFFFLSESTKIEDVCSDFEIKIRGHPFQPVKKRPGIFWPVKIGQLFYVNEARGQ